ncbi:TniQ family protein [Yoonia sp. 2307UL14-13]|uniref:TniQ family protein n=1 Tax=Yoonia sp. 2307UL14-13 TaxID=3126506 RepID=UPI0030A77659
MGRLSIKPEPILRETLPSYVSRAAAMNRVDLKNFCVDIGFSIKRLINLAPEALEIIAEIADLDDAAMGNLVQWTGKKADDVRMIFRNEKFVSRALRNPTIRGCPICLQDDADGSSTKPLESMAMRGDWQLREVSVCVRHRHPLIPLWRHQIPTERFDISARLAELLENMLEDTLKQERISLNAYDLWLDQRLENGRDDTWLAGQPLYAATTFCRLLGSELLRLPEYRGVRGAIRLRTAQRIGFGVASEGREAIDDALDRLASLAPDAGDLPHKAFGELYRDLAYAHLNESAFDDFRRILWERIVMIWPVAANHEILGRSLPERRLHSLTSAAKETGVGEFLLDQFLVEAGAYDQGDERPAARKTFDATRHASLLAEIPTLVGPIEMWKAIGATRSQFKSLVDDKVLVPRTRIPTVKSPWRLQDGVDLLRELTALVTGDAEDQNQWEVVQQAKLRSGLSVGQIIDAMRNGRLHVARLKGLAGYRSLCVSKVEIDHLAAEVGVPVEAPSKLPAEVVSSAAAFGRSVGMREGQAFQRLVMAGHTSASHEVISNSGARRFYVTEDDIAAFHRRFLTQMTLADEYNGFWRTLVTELYSGGVERFTVGGETFGHLFLRTDVERFFGRKAVIER